ncbi:hypothetical protein [Bradyrhizobium sp. 142]|uniref:hypothetical protein n=1 Tax=Bradyrhizobium sp. 142 TaxID=2782618 RepID=UPI001FF7988D|nr:hypothetical protein [Bradyrhizobium sp. 142]MCK1726503.1 hypothetical protein [Bradyrhizobium sp. 142]
MAIAIQSFAILSNSTLVMPECVPLTERKNYGPPASAPLRSLLCSEANVLRSQSAVIVERNNSLRGRHKVGRSVTVPDEGDDRFFLIII